MERLPSAAPPRKGEGPGPARPDAAPDRIIHMNAIDDADLADTAEEGGREHQAADAVVAWADRVIAVLDEVTCDFARLARAAEDEGHPLYGQFDPDKLRRAQHAVGLCPDHVLWAAQPARPYFFEDPMPVEPRVVD